jgi:hypothetical protein
MGAVSARPSGRAGEADLTGTLGAFARTEGSGDEPAMADITLAKGLRAEVGCRTPERAAGSHTTGPWVT